LDPIWHIIFARKGEEGKVAVGAGRRSGRKVEEGERRRKEEVRV
jgi:hypothetical protein